MSTLLPVATPVDIGGDGGDVPHIE